MATKRVTVSVPSDVAKMLKRAAGTRSVSEYVTKALTRALEDDESRAAFLEFCASVPKTAEDRRWAKEAFASLQSSKPLRRKARKERGGKAAA